MYSKYYYNKHLRDAARQLRKNMTEAESKMWYEFLRFNKPRAHRQRPMGRFIADFYIPKAKLIIEIDGDVHENEKSLVKDSERTEFFNTLGLTVIRFTNTQVIYNFKQVCEEIKRHIHN
jgi:very-short-patch-repair endonuclease